MLKKEKQTTIKILNSDVAHAVTGPPQFERDGNPNSSGSSHGHPVSSGSSRAAARGLWVGRAALIASAFLGYCPQVEI